MHKWRKNIYKFKSVRHRNGLFPTNHTKPDCFFSIQLINLRDSMGYETKYWTLEENNRYGSDTLKISMGINGQ